MSVRATGATFHAAVGLVCCSVLTFARAPALQICKRFASQGADPSLLPLSGAAHEMGDGAASFALDLANELLLDIYAPPSAPAVRLGVGCDPNTPTSGCVWEVVCVCVCGTWDTDVSTLSLCAVEPVCGAPCSRCDIVV